MAESQVAVQACLGASPAVCTPHSATLTQGKWGLALIKSVGFHRISRGTKIQTAPRTAWFLPFFLAHGSRGICARPGKTPTAWEQAALGCLCQVSSCRFLLWQEADPTVWPVPRLVNELCSLLLPDQPSRAC